MKRVLIIGRPNVGKSSLFNRLIKKRRALVLDTPGVTRDILKEEASWWGGEFEVWDSGGMVWDTSSSIFSSVTLSVRKAIQQVDLIILIVDAHTGLHDEDRRIFELVKNKNYLLVVNKVDHPQKFDDQINEFWKFGIDFITASFEKAENIDCIVDWILKNISDEKQETIEKKKVSLLITGQPNVGKSSLCNKILKMDRMVTSPIAHTTVDIVDEIFDFKGEKYKILDTAGIRKQSRRSGDLEKLASLKTLDFLKNLTLFFFLLTAQKNFHDKI